MPTMMFKVQSNIALKNNNINNKFMICKKKKKINDSRLKPIGYRDILGILQFHKILYKNFLSLVFVCLFLKKKLKKNKKKITVIIIRTK